MSHVVYILCHKSVNFTLKHVKSVKLTFSLKKIRIDSLMCKFHRFECKIYRLMYKITNESLKFTDEIVKFIILKCAY